MGWIKRFFKNLVGKLVLPAQAAPIGPKTLFKSLAANTVFTPHEHKKLSKAWTNFHHQNSVNKEIKNGNAIGHVHRFGYHVNENLIDSVEIAPTESLPDLAIIYAWGRRDIYENHLNHMASDALNLNALCVSFNYPGVGFSEGAPLSFQDLADVVVEHVHRLMAKGYQPHQIKLYGHSLGGAVEILAAWTLRQQGIVIPGFSDRSLGDLKASAKALYQNKPHVRRKWVRTFLGLPMLAITGLLVGAMVFTPVTWAVGLFTGLCLFTGWLDKALFAPLNFLQDKIMVWTGWDIDAAAIFEQLQDHDHINIVKPSKTDSQPILGKRYVHPERDKDRVIQTAESLHKSLENRRNMKKDIKNQINEAREHGQSAEVARLESLLLTLSNNKCTGGDHSDPLDQLVMRYPQQDRWVTAQEKLYHFMRPDDRHLGPTSRQYRRFSTAPAA